MVNVAPYSEVKATLDRLADVNAALQEHARRFCGTHLTDADWQALQKLLIVRENALRWLAIQDLFVDVGSNVWKAPRCRG